MLLSIRKACHSRGLPIGLCVPLDRVADKAKGLFLVVVIICLVIAD